VTTERVIKRTVPPVVVVQKEVLRDTVVREVPVLVGDTASMKADTAAVAAQDSVMNAAPRSAPPLPAEPAPHVRSALEMQRDHAQQMNRMLTDRIFTLERYLAMQEEFGGSGELDSLRQRIAVLDKQLAAKRAEAPERVEDPEEWTPLTDSVRFASESFHVKANYRERLEATARRVMEEDVKKVLVTGHTDRAGDAQYNLELSQRRAEAVAEVLREAGVPAERIKVKGLGQQLAQERHDRNERVVIVQAVPAE
jgi:outer membrane protein OmpA-like peptidoglycan-associated protein